MSLRFSSKARTLDTLKGVLEKARIAPVHAFSVADWRSDRQACLASMMKDLDTTLLIVRSSCGREDGAESSNAGAFLSLPNVNTEGLEKAVDRVVPSAATTRRRSTDSAAYSDSAFWCGFLARSAPALPTG